MNAANPFFQLILGLWIITVLPFQTAQPAHGSAFYESAYQGGQLTFAAALVAALAFRALATALHRNASTRKQGTKGHTL